MIKIIIKSLSADIVFCWFASVYAFVGVFMGRVLGKRSYVVAGGVDAAKNKEIGYGIWLNPFKSKLARYTFRNANRVLAVDNYIRENIIRLAKYEGDNIVCLPTGYDINYWVPGGQKENIVLTVAIVNNTLTWKVKGLDVLLETAGRMPDVSFIVVGVPSDFAKRYKIPPNMKTVDPVARKEILLFYQKAMVYCQPSRSEGLSNALCEAMACGCIPVATDVGGNPNALGDAGILVSPGDPEALALALSRALKMPESAGNLARTRIINLFPRHKREDELLKILNRDGV